MNGINLNRIKVQIAIFSTSQYSFRYKDPKYYILYVVSKALSNIIFNSLQTKHSKCLNLKPH